jgi:hypothetical protein
MRVWIKPRGHNMGNRALQYLAAEGIRQHAPEIAVENIRLPEWGMHTEHPAPQLRRLIRTGEHRSWLDVAGLADCLRRGVVDTVQLDEYPFHLANFPPRAVARRLFGPTSGGAAAPGFAAHELVCSIRGAEVLAGKHGDYLVLPPSYYRALAERSGLALVFFGQLGDDAYTHTLRAAFPAARFVPSVNPEYDFEMLRRSQNIALSVSTFAWAAAWLSTARKIYLPVCGIFSPVQQPHQFFLPLDEPEYEYTLFPYAQAVNLYEAPADFMRVQELLGQYARPAGVAELEQLVQRAAALVPRLPLLAGFDEAFYLSWYGDVAALLERGLGSGLEHYHLYGFFEGRHPLPIDKAFYTRKYPDAAMAIAQGAYASPLHHYQAVGRAKGYDPLP